MEHSIQLPCMAFAFIPVLLSGSSLTIPFLFLLRIAPCWIRVLACISGFLVMPSCQSHAFMSTCLFKSHFAVMSLRVASCGNAGLLLHATASMSSGQNFFLQTSIASTMLAGECEPSLLSRYLAARVYFADMCAARPRMSVPVLQWSWSQ